MPVLAFFFENGTCQASVVNGPRRQSEVIHQRDTGHPPASFTAVIHCGLFSPRTIPLSFTRGVQMTSCY